MPGALVVENYRELSRAFAKADREVRLDWRRSQRAIAEPVRRDASSLAASEISGMAKSPKWAGMRIGVTQRMVYVAPRQRGVKTKGRSPRRRPNLAGLLMERAMEPALRQNEGRIEREFERLLDQMADDFNRGGPL